MTPLANILFLFFLSLVVSQQNEKLIVQENEISDNGIDIEPQEPCPALKSDIVGGQATNVRSHPYQVSFTIFNRFFCGGFIVSPNYIMTAAHCVQRATPAGIRLRVGSTFRDAGGRIVPVTNISVHPSYNNPPFDNDIAVMRVAQRLRYGPTIAAISLPANGQPVPSGMVTVTGWGLTMQGGRRIPRTMMRAQVPVIWQWVCRLSYGQVITDRMFCAGNFLIGGRSSCQGDSGGAAVINGTAFGIVSYARGCALPLSPTVFARIPALRAWVTSVTGI